MPREWLEPIQEALSGRSIWSFLAVAAISIVVALLAKVVLKLFSVRLRKFAERTVSKWDDVGIDILDGLKAWVLFIWIFFLLTKSLNPSEFVRKLTLIAMVLASTFQIGLWGLYLIRNWFHAVFDRRIQQDPSSAAALGLLNTVIQVSFLAIVVLIGASNLGINVSALVAGLGVGGIAVALAAQNVLGDLLASLSIVLDKPFVIGDFIVAGDEKGTVEHIGVKTTRLRSLSGEQLVLSNKDLLESRIQNYKRMRERRVVQRFRVIYSTPAAALERIPEWVKQIVAKNDQLRFDRCHFAGYGESSLDFEFVFFVSGSDYNFYMDLQQKVLLGIFKKFREEKIEFALPAQTVYVEKFPELKEKRL